jgi:2-dehydro-3-deoxyphosphogluconate aldolase/(4S)-4-hydroxy-2-oxoglutarate aldolase
MLQQLRAARVVPVVRMRSAAHAETAVDWLRESGIRIFEITMTIPGAVELIRRLAADSSMLVGAGTVQDAATAVACLDAGA